MFSSDEFLLAEFKVSRGRSILHSPGLNFFDICLKENPYNQR